MSLVQLCLRSRSIDDWKQFVEPVMRGTVIGIVMMTRIILQLGTRKMRKLSDDEEDAAFD